MEARVESFTQSIVQTTSMSMSMSMPMSEIGALFDSAERTRTYDSQFYTSPVWHWAQ